MCKTATLKATKPYWQKVKKYPNKCRDIQSLHNENLIM